MTKCKHTKRKSQTDEKSVTTIRTVRLENEEALLHQMAEEGYFEWRRDECGAAGWVRIEFMLSS